LPPYRNLGSEALFSCDICLYIPVDSTLLYSSVALECKLSSSSTLQIPTGGIAYVHPFDDAPNRIVKHLIREQEEAWIETNLEE
jgi:hypothetical protein